jgi:hypothetical protein
MPKYKVITRSPIGAEKLEIYEEVIECDNVTIDQTGKYLLFFTAAKIEILAGADSPKMSLRIIKWINTDYIIECFDIHYTSKVAQALSN